MDTIAVDRIHRNFETRESHVRAMTEFGLSDNDAKLFIYRAFLDRALKGVPRHLMFEVYDHYFDPGYDEFQARSSLVVVKRVHIGSQTLKPMKQYEGTARLGQFFTNERADREGPIGKLQDQLRELTEMDDEKKEMRQEFDDVRNQIVDTALE